MTKGLHLDMPTQIQILLVPYDSGHRSLRMGGGPEHLVDNGLAQVLEADGHEVFVETVDSQSDFRAEVQTQFGLYRSLAEHVAGARRNGKFPLVLSGNCGATVGAIAGADSRRLGVVWFDTHGEFNTPETTTSGFLDGMGLAIATGRCWTTLAASIPDFRPIPGSSILLVGGHDFDAGERERLEEAGVMVVDADVIAQMGVQEALHSKMPEFLRGVEEIHLHIDLDVLNPNEAPANGFVTEKAGLSVNQLSEAIALIKENLKITSATIASFDPNYDPQGKTLSAALQLIRQMTGGEQVS
jgi:arginase